MKIPGPEHPITIRPGASRWRAQFAGHVIADTTDALILQEADYPPVVYFPRADVSMEYMSRTAAQTHCPYKGDAAYYTLLMDGNFAENAVWTYEQPYPAMKEIAGRLAFYTDRVEIYAVDDAQMDAHQRGTYGTHSDTTATVADVVQHTDSGSGAAQKEHWAANVDEPGVNEPGVNEPGRDDGGLR